VGRHSISAVIILICFHSILRSQSSDTSSSEIQSPQFHPVSMMAVPAVLISSGLLSMHERGPYSSQDAYRDIQTACPGFHTDADDYFQFMPMIAVYGLNLAGIKGKHNFVDRTMIYLMSVTMAELTTDGLKRGTHILRPDSSDYRSFPSGHTTNAFVSATFLFNEYRDVSIWYGIAGYSVATATGVIRMLNNKHWMSDVLVGAGMGIFFTELTYYVYPAIKHFFCNRVFNRDLQALSFSPYYSQDNMGIHLNVRF